MLALSDKSKVILALITACFLSFIYNSLNWIDIIDDAYIFFRYAHNISQGHGYVFNIGQSVEGTTSVTWTAMLVALDILHMPAELSVKVIGVLCVLATLLLLGAGFYKVGVPSSIMLLVFALLVFDGNFTLSLMMGLETGIYTLLLVAICVTSRWYSQEEGRLPSVVIGVIGVLLFLTRPESIAILILIGSGMVFYRHKYNAGYWAIPILIWILGIFFATLWRWFTFGDFIPNSARAKSVLTFSDLHWSLVWPRIVMGATYIKKTLAASWLLVALGLVGLAGIWRSFWAYVAFSALLTGVVVVFINSGDWMPFFRMLTPYLPVAALLAGVGIHKLRLSIGNLWPRTLELVSVFVAVLITSTSLWSLRDKHFFAPTLWPSGECYVSIGRALRPHLSNQSVVASEGIGKLGYTLTDIPILDIFGLTDSYIARHGVIPIETYNLGRHNYEYVMHQNPTLMFFHSNIVNHIPLLNQWGYSQAYQTFNVADTQAHCEMLVGVKNSSVPALLPVFEQNFVVQAVDTSKVQRNAATWPEGER
jgi:hypothetical protein